MEARKFLLPSSGESWHKGWRFAQAIEKALAIHFSDASQERPFCTFFVEITWHDFRGIEYDVCFLSGKAENERKPCDRTWCSEVV